MQQQWQQMWQRHQQNNKEMISDKLMKKSTHTHTQQQQPQHCNLSNDWLVMANMEQVTTFA